MGTRFVFLCAHRRTHAHTQCPHKSSVERKNPWLIDSVLQTMTAYVMYIFQIVNTLTLHNLYRNKNFQCDTRLNGNVTAYNTMDRRTN